MTKEKKFEKYLQEEWRNQFAAEKDEAKVNAAIKEAALNVVAQKEALDIDPDICSLKEKLSTATEPYKTGIKTNQVKIEFLKDVLSSQGKEVPSAEDFAKSPEESIEE